MQQLRFPKLLPILRSSLLFLAMLLLPGFPTAAANGLTWTPSMLTTTVAPGESRRFDVTFTASYALNHAVVDVASELQPFVDVRPRVLTGIATGQTVHLTVTISLAAPRLPGTVTGAVRLFHELHIGMKGGGIRILRWPVPFANPLLLTVGAASAEAF
jgi:hypothetical protein